MMGLGRQEMERFKLGSFKILTETNMSISH